MTITMFIAYLIGAFIATSWNPVEWTEHLRMVMFAFGFCYGVALWARLEWEYK